MTLTRRLYKVEEVRAALLFCIRCRRIQEADYWLRELEDSWYGAEARRVLFIAWFLFVGLKRVSWLVEWSTHSESQEGRRQLCWQLIRCTERDSSLWWILCAAPLTDCWTSSHLLGLWRSNCTKDPSEVWEWVVNKSTSEKIDTCMDALQIGMRGYGRLCILTAVCLVNTRLPSSSWAPVSSQTPDGLSCVSKEESLRKQRERSIPYDCLYGFTWRGRGGDSTEEFRNLNWKDFEVSPVWRTLGKEYFTETGWKGDCEKELFWDRYFPWTTCDHPDEWSKVDREKSHGPGVSCDYGAPLIRWWNNWISSNHSWIWGKPVWKVLEWVRKERADVGASVLDRILQLYSNLASVEYTRSKKEFILESTTS